MAAASLIVPATAHAAVSRHNANGTNYIISTEHPEATRAGSEILKNGGSAADAAIAAYIVLSLVNPQTASLAGGGIVLHYQNSSSRLEVFEALETAPEQAGQYLFIGQDGSPLSLNQAMVGGRSVGVPGIPALISILHEKFGKVRWSDLFTSALVLSETGFEITPEVSNLISQDAASLGRYTEGRQYFLTAFGNPRSTGDKLENPAYSVTLRQFITGGHDIFYQEDFAKDIVMAVQKRAHDNRGLMSIEDITGYMATRSDPSCIAYRGKMVCTAGPVSSEGTWLLQTLGMLERFQLGKMNLESPDPWHLVAQASRLSYADRSAFIADPDFSILDAQRLLSPDYLEKRSSLISAGIVNSGQPTPGQLARASLTVDPKETGICGTPIVAADRYGNSVILIAGIHKPFGSRLFVNGMLLNSALIDFSFASSGGDGSPVLNKVEGKKRPRSGIAPVAVLGPDGRPELLVAAPGGSRNAARVLQRLLAYIDWKVPASELAKLPDFTALDDIEISSGGRLGRSLEKLGHTVKSTDFEGGLMIIELKGGSFSGYISPVNEGMILAE